ncbi:MAG: diguanylate cyclase domain-containing protein [Wenzhouxiangella sp.]
MNRCLSGRLARFVALGVLALALSVEAPLATANESNDPDDWLSGCERLEHGQPEEALILARRALDQADTLTSFQQIRAFHCQAAAHSQLGQTELALAALDQGLAQIAALDDPATRIRAQSRASSIGYRLGRIDQAVALTTHSLRLAESAGLSEQLPEIIGRLAVFQSDSGQVELAVENYRRALALLDPETQAPLIMPMRYNLGITLRRMGEFAEALDVLEPLLPMIEAPGLESRRASLLSLMGGLYLQLGNRDQAQAFFEESLALHETFDNPAERAALLRELTRLYREEGNLTRSRETAEESLALSRRSADEQSVIHSLEFLVETLAAQGEFELALAHHREMAQRSEALLNQQMNSQLADAEALLRDQQREAELEQLRQERALQAIERDQQTLRQRLWTAAAIALLVLSVIGLLIQRANNRRLDRVSRQDPLTGLPNRRALSADLGPAPKNRPDHFSVLFLLDLDHFKRINDVHGHDSGDRALLATADFLAGYANQHQGRVGRWGGEEFALQINNLSDTAACEHAQSLVRGIAALQIAAMNGAAVGLSASVGFAPIEPGLAKSGQERWEPALNCADQLLYRAKKAGRNGWFGVWPTDHGSVLEPLELERQIETGECRLLNAEA